MLITSINLGYDIVPDMRGATTRKSLRTISFS